MDETITAETPETAPVARKKPGRKPGRPATSVAALEAQVAALTALVQGQAAGVPAGMTPELFLQAMERQAEILRSNRDIDQEMAANVHAQAMKKALRPENEIAPGISVYNPKGEVKFPRPKPTHIYMMGPYPIADPGDYQTVTWTELELLNQLQPGTFPVTKADGTTVKLTVKTEFATDGKTPYRTTLIMPMADDEQKQGWPPLMQVLTEVVTGEQPMQSFARMQAIIDRQAAELAALKAAHAA